jgi:hypothetical protein
MCASIFLGHFAEISQKFREYLVEGYHWIPSNHGLNISLLVRVLNFFESRRRRYIVWHGPLGVLFFTTAVIQGARSVSTRSAFEAAILFVVAAIVLGVFAHVRWLRNRRHALRSFARDSFDTGQAMERFAARRRQGYLDCFVSPQEAASNVCVFGSFDPFVGSGGSLREWSLLIDVRKGKEGRVPVPFTGQDLENAIAAAFRRLPLPEMQIGQRLYVHGRDVQLVDGLLPDRFDRPRQRVSEETLARFRQNDAKEARIYQFVELSAWGDQICVSFLYRVTLTGPMLYVENHTRVLQPLDSKYWAVDTLAIPGLGTQIAQLLGHVIVAPFVCIGECFSIFELFGSDLMSRLRQKERKKRIAETTRFNYGAITSLRESFAAAIHKHFFERSDRNRYEKVLQKQVLDSIIDFLEARDVDTSDLREQRIFMANSGLIVHGNVEAGALAVGDSARANVRGAAGKILKGGEETGGVVA